MWAGHGAYRAVKTERLAADIGMWGEICYYVKRFALLRALGVVAFCVGGIIFDSLCLFVTGNRLYIIIIIISL